MQNSTFDWKIKGLFPVPLVKIKLENTQKFRDFLFAEMAQSQSSPSTTSQSKQLHHLGSGENILNKYAELRTLREDITKAAEITYKDLLNHKRSGEMALSGS